MTVVAFVALVALSVPAAAQQPADTRDLIVTTGDATLQRTATARAARRGR